MKKSSLFLILLLIIFLSSCNDKNDNIIHKNISGKIEKGPFLEGSKVSLFELDKNLRQTGKKTFKTETQNNKGDFIFDGDIELESQFVELEIAGYFFNEITGLYSTSPITLNALADISNKNLINVNILTHLEYKRIKKLVAEGSNFAQAQEKAQKELLTVFHITKEIKKSDDIGLTDGNEDAAVLLAISALLLYNKGEAEFSEFLAKMSNDLADDGKISSNEILEKIRDAQNNLPALTVMNNLKEYFSTQGAEIIVENIRKHIDSNGDGILDDKDENYESELEIEPPVIIDVESFFKNENEYKAFLMGSYMRVQSYFERITTLDAIRCNQINYREEINPFNAIVAEAWGYAYQSINVMNVLIKHSAGVKTFDAKPYLSTAISLRALIYLDMIQHWGDIPYITNIEFSPDFSPKRNKKEEIYQVLLTDLKDNINFLPKNATIDSPIVSQELVNLLIGTVYLELKDYDSAKIYLERIINDGNKSIDLSDAVYNDISNKEALFSLVYTDEQTVYPFRLFKEQLKKGKLHPIYRYTGLLINQAEIFGATNKRENVLTILNQLRAMKNMPLLNEPVENIQKEIASLYKEIIGTDYGYFAVLKRLNLAIELLNIQAFQQLYPIPQREIDLNQNITQNPGY